MFAETPGVNFPKLSRLRGNTVVVIFHTEVAYQFFLKQKLVKNMKYLSI